MSGRRWDRRKLETRPKPGKNKQPVSQEVEKQEDKTSSTRCSPGNKVKTESAKRGPKPATESPSLKRLQPPKFARNAPGTSPICQKPRNSLFKTQNFKQHLSKWEDISTISLTPSVYKKPRSPNFVDSQPGEVLQKSGKKLKMLGQPYWTQMLKVGVDREAQPMRNLLRNFLKILTFEEKVLNFGTQT